MTLTHAAMGVSNHDDTVTAVTQAVAQALSGHSDHNPPALAFCTATVARNIEQVRQLFVEHLPQHTRIHGITSRGAVLTTTSGVIKRGVACLLLWSDQASAEDLVTSFHPTSATTAVRELQQQMTTTTTTSPQLIFLGATPSAEDEVLQVLAQEYPHVPVFGGTAADDELTGAWKVFSSSSSSASSDTGVSLVGIGNSVTIGTSMVAPYTPTSRTGVATRTQGSRRVLQINDQPAADWVYDWIGNTKIKDEYENGGMILPATASTPIGVSVQTGRNHSNKRGGWGGFWRRNSHKNKDYIPSHCAALGGADKWVDFFTPVPQGSTLVVMEAGDGPSTGYAAALNQAYDQAWKELVQQSKRKNKNKGKTKGNKSQQQPPIVPKAGLLIFCGGMAMAAGDNLNKGLTNKDFVRKTKDLPLMGMVCYGEQAYLSSTKTNVQRNLSVGMILFG